jgi:hypothetical protein
MFFFFFFLGLDVEISGIEPGTVETDVQVSKYCKTLIISHEFLLTVMMASQCCGRCRRKSAFIFLAHDLTTLLASVSKQSTSFLWKRCEMNMK